MKRNWACVLLLLLWAGPSFAQDARSLLRSVNARFSKVREYQAKVRITTDIPFVRMMPVNADVFYRQPDQFRLRSKSIALMPRQGFDQLFRNLNDTLSYMPVFFGNDQWGGKTVSIVQILPLSDTADLVLGKLWIDPQRQLILRSQMTTRTNGMVDASYFFGKQESVALPDSIVFTIDTKRFKIPKAVAADLNNVQTPKSTPTKEKQKGNIYLRFSEYRINQGLPPDIFKK